MKTRICIFDTAINITGAFTCARNEVSLLKEDFDFILILPKNSKIEKEHLKDFRNVYYIPVVNIQKRLLSLVLYIPFLLITSYQISSILKNEKCSVLQLNDYFLIQGLFSRIFGFKGKTFTWVRFDPDRFGILTKIWMYFNYKLSDKIVTVSNFIKNKLPSNPKNLMLYDPIFFEENSNVITRKNKIVYIANYTYGKGQQHAIEAINLISEKLKDFELHFYGGDFDLDKNKEYKNSLIELTSKHNLKNKIFFHEFEKDTQKVLEESYIALNFSESESFSMTCLEASYYGTPMISTKSGGPQEIIEHNKTGILVEKADINKMSIEILRLIENPNLVNSMSNEAERYVRDKFSQKIFVENIKNLFEEKN